MTSGGYTMTEGWNLQLQGRVRRLEEALRDARDYVEATALNTGDLKKKANYYGCVRRIDAALATVSEADIAVALGEPSQEGASDTAASEPPPNPR